MGYFFLGLAVFFLWLLWQDHALIRRIQREEEDKMIAEGILQPKWWRWQHGRQEARYSKMLLATSQRLKFDCYLIKIMDGSAIPEHTDPAVEGFEHHRVNVFLWCTKLYDKHLTVQGPSKTWLFGRIMYFRPDLYKHSMRHMNQMWTGKATYILSIGWLKKAR